MPKAQKCTDNFILTKKLFLAGLRGLQSISDPVERPCTEQFHDFFSSNLYKDGGQIAPKKKKIKQRITQICTWNTKSVLI